LDLVEMLRYNVKGMPSMKERQEFISPQLVPNAKCKQNYTSHTFLSEMNHRT